MIQGLDRGLYGNGAQLKLMQVHAADLPAQGTLVSGSQVCSPVPSAQGPLPLAQRWAALQKCEGP